ncbi:vesicle-associated membrane protein 7B-like [Antedon mediterranea]|uniref:vesicle-associated membrane protein 7B-like n=1 Tax=Antedon mediterranea TaxID=105859 RepID=UPI003AF836C7
MPILYSCVARGKNILVDHTSSNEGSFSQVASSALHNISTSSDYKTIYEADQYLFFVYVKSGVTYLCAAEKDYSRTKAYDYLLDIIEKTESYTVSQDSEFTQQQREEITKIMTNSSGKPVNTKLTKLQDDVDELQDIMIHNVEQILKRGDKLDDLMEKSDLLELQAQSFAKTTKKVHKKYWYKNARYKVILGVIIGIVVVTILVIIIVVAT